MTTSISSLFHVGLFRKHNFVVSHLKHLTPKTAIPGISKMWSTIFLPSKLTEILGDSRFKFIKTQMFNISIMLKDTKKVDLILDSFFDALYAIYQLSEIKDDIQVASQFLCCWDTLYHV